jgi:beta-glucosidase
VIAWPTVALFFALTLRLAAQPFPYQNPDLPPDVRAADLVSRMTLAEKVSQMQNAAPAIPRLGIPDYDWWSESLHGVARAGLATAFPQAIGLSASFDISLMQRLADAISTEARAKFNDAQSQGNHSRYHGLTFWSPNINLFRDPRWGRGQETYGEDPFLTASMAAAFIQGMQGTDAIYLKTVATAKHFAVHSGPEPARHTFDAEVSTQDLEGSYLAAFRASVQTAGVSSLMCAYNSVNGAPACASTDLLQTHLRAAWGFNGYVVSDCGAITDIANGHHYAPGITEAAALAVRAGTDLSCGTEYSLLADAVSRNLISETEIDRAVTRLFTARFRLGMFDPPDRVPYASIPLSVVDSQANRSLALEAAERSMVLLKNTGILPLSPSTRRIAVVGPSADWPDMQMANYAGTPSHIVTPLAGIRQRFGATADIRFALGSTYTAISPALMPGEALQTPDGALGLLAQYFATNDFSGAPALTRTDARVYFNWDTQDPAVVAAIPRDRFAVRWTGTLTAPYTGEYVLGLAHSECGDCVGGDQGRIYLDGQLIADENLPVAYLHATRGARVQLTAGSRHDLRIDFQQDHGNRGVELVWIPPADALIAEAQSAISQSEVTLLLIGLNADLESEESGLQMPGFAFGDRTDLNLPAPQQTLLQAALKSGKPVIVVLTTGSAIAAAGADQQAAAILEAWYPGQEGGTAIAQVLAGDYNPAGRLPVTFYQSIDQLPPFDDYNMAGRTYRFFSGQPLYSFGYGLSYSHFRYSHVVRRGPLVVTRVTNISARDGDEVVQLYVSANGAVPALAGFQRVHIQAHKSLPVEFTLTPDALSDGRVRLWIGSGPPSVGRNAM